MKKNKIISVWLFISIALFSYSVQAQTDNPQQRDYKVRPVRLGVKLGFPNLVGGNLEYVTPFLNDKLAVNLDYSMIKSDWFISEKENDTETTNLDFTYLEAGFNYYFFKAGKGLYGGLSYNNMKFEGQTSVEAEDGREGTGFIDYNHNSINIKLGAKLGGLFYFRPEIGYSFSSLPKTFDYEVDYGDGTTEKETYDFSEELASADFLFKGLMANIGFGFAF